MEKFCSFCKSFLHIDWTPTTVIICMLPIMTTLVLLDVLFTLLAPGRGAVVSGSETCAAIGQTVLKDGGSAVDAAIATAVCESVVLPNRVGIGGGFTGIMYMGGVMKAINAMPLTPAKLPRGKNIVGTQDFVGAQAAGVPGELRGFWEMHQKYGVLPWYKLFQPSIKLCEEGVVFSEHVYRDLAETAAYLRMNPKLKDLVYKIIRKGRGAQIRLPALGQTLRLVASDGVEIFYNGDLGEAFVDDVQAGGGFITMNDLRNYHTSWSPEPIEFKIGTKLVAFTTPIPTAGAIVVMAMNILKKFKTSDTPAYWHIVVEAMKHAFGHGLGLGDYEHGTSKEDANLVRENYENMINDEFAKQIRGLIREKYTTNATSYYGVRFQPLQQSGSTNICVISQAGDAVALTTSLMSPSGADFLCEKTGIMLNSQLSSFNLIGVTNLSLAPGANVGPGKRSFVPHSATIVLDRKKRKVTFVVGAEGGSYIPAQIITGLIRYFLLQQSVRNVVKSGFFHPQLFNHVVEHSMEIPTATLDYFQSIGHGLSIITPSKKKYSLTCIGNKNQKPVPEISGHEGEGLIIDSFPSLNVLMIITVSVTVLVVISFTIKDVLQKKDNKPPETSA